MRPLFEAGIEAKDEIYLQVRDNPRFAEARESLEQLWQVYQPYADTNFLDEFPRQFASRFWEMYLACTFLDQGLRITKVGDSGPDFSVTIDGRTIWIEAKAITGGTGVDAVKELPRLTEDGEASGFTIPEGKVLLRYTSGIKEKRDDYIHYRKCGLIGESEPCIVAILDAVPLPYDEFDDELPMAVKAVYGIGDETWDPDWEENRFHNQRYLVRRSIDKQSGKSVDMDVFLKEDYAGVSGILVSRVDAYNCLSRSLGYDFVFVHNVNATNPVDKSLLRYEKEYWIDESNYLIMGT